MQSRKPHGVRFNRGLKLFGLFLTSIAFFNLVFSDKTSALYIPTLSASVDNADASVNGNQVINSTNKTTEIPLNLTVSTNNKTGYTATLSSETDETALVNDDSTNGAKINSISAASALSNFSDNTWGVKIGSSTNFSPIPKSTSPMNIMQTDGKTYDSETNGIKIGLKLSDNLESGSYTNKLVFSILTNDYDRIALMTNGPDFNTKLKSLETATNKIERFRKSTVAPAASMDAVNIEGAASDYEIRLWLDPTDKTAYYYTEPEKVYLDTDSSRMFYSIYYEQEIKNILEIDLSGFDTSKVTTMYDMFAYMSKLTTLNLSHFDTSKVTNMNNMFYHMPALTTINLSSFDTSNVTDMSGMFSGMSKLTTLNLSHFDTSKVTNMGFMFSDMFNLTNLDLSSFDTSKVTSMRYMFDDMSKLTTLNLSHFDTSKVTNMGYMFSGMSNLTNLDLSSFDTSMVTDMYAMFSDMSNLTALNLSNFDTSKVTTMYAMFRNMPNLTTLDLSNFDTSQVTDMKYMFYLPYKDKLNDKLEKIYVNNDFNTAKLTDFSEMFKNRNKLRGGNGSFLVNPGAADKSWLRIDDPTNGRPGYFTRKP